MTDTDRSAADTSGDVARVPAFIVRGYAEAHTNTEIRDMARELLAARETIARLEQGNDAIETAKSLLRRAVHSPDVVKQLGEWWAEDVSRFLNRPLSQGNDAAGDGRQASQQRLCELMDICRPYVEIGLEVRAELRRALLRLYQLSTPKASQDVQDVQEEVRKILLDIEEHSPDDFARSMARQSLALLQRQPSEARGYAVPGPTGPAEARRPCPNCSGPASADTHNLHMCSKCNGKGYLGQPLVDLKNCEHCNGTGQKRIAAQKERT